MYRKKRSAGCILAALIMLIIFANPVMAEIPAGDTAFSLIETNEPGSITIQLGDTGEKHPKAGVRIAAAQVAEVVDGRFVLTEKYKASGVDLNKLQTANDLEYAAETLMSMKIAAEDIAVTDDDGRAAFHNLEVGVYLIYATDTADYESIAASLVSIPVFETKDGVMSYDIEIFPKHSPIPEIPQTGDGSGLFWYGSAFILSFIWAAGLYVILLFRKNCKRK